MSSVVPMRHDQFESDFWGNCANTYGEERKQLVYAKRMGLRLHGDWRSDFNIDMAGKSVIDIGGGPASLLLKCIRLGDSFVVDPLPFPDWVYRRYQCAGIGYAKCRGEDIDSRLSSQVDEAWIYNALQHCDDPVKIISNARHVAKVVRLFEWIDIPAHLGHPQMLTEPMLKEALSGMGQTEQLNEDGCFGRAFYGVWYA